MAIKVELCNVYNKMQVLRSKTKCTESKKHERVKIRSCETHYDLVNRQNTNQLLKLIGMSEKYVVVGNRLLKLKDELKKKDTEEGSSGGGSNGDNTPSGSKPDVVNEKAKSEEDGDARGKVGDKKAHVVDPKQKHPESNPNKLTNPEVTKPEPKKADPPRRNPSRTPSTSAGAGGTLTTQGGSSQGNNKSGGKKGNRN